MLLLPVLLLAACGSDEGSTALPAAADGTNLAACTSGTCDVQVKNGDQIPNPQLGTIAVVVKDDKIELSTHSDNGNGNSMSLSGSAPEGKMVVLNDQSFTVVAVRGDQGVLHLGG